MRPTQCKHSFFFLVGETRCCWRRTKYADIPTAAHTFPTAALGLAAALAIRPRNPQERSIPVFTFDQSTRHWKVSQLQTWRCRGLEILELIVADFSKIFKLLDTGS